VNHAAVTLFSLLLAPALARPQPPAAARRWRSATIALLAIAGGVLIVLVLTPIIVGDSVGETAAHRDCDCHARADRDAAGDSDADRTADAASPGAGDDCVGLGHQRRALGARPTAAIFIAMNWGSA
jgi:hypothetical protein